ncbi:dipeptidase [Acerihabitans sp. TG2]|uniref:dipeptidase n=1 Tax=Acerihabitans sp. TG2 TaxID=3096008 RepID=UPI002B23A2A8|nr:dipeptidase [Acerihabitans sp. TG2]MEA9392443.1 dipeptidase [Acerihabitans sp. TG2]
MNTDIPQPFFDGHNDLLLNLWLHHGDDPAEAFYAGLVGQLDYPRMRRGGFAGGLFAVFVPPAAYLTNMRLRGSIRDETDCAPLAISAAQIEILHTLAQDSQGRARICRSVDDIEYCLRNNVLAMVLHLEGAQSLDTDLLLLDQFYQQGLRSIGPFWNEQNQFGSGVKGDFPGSPDTGPGMTPAGKALIEVCNQKRILIDLSHMNEKAFWQMAELSDAPLVATHSNAHTICPQPRNLTDMQLAAIAASDGLVGVNFGTAFLRGDGKHDGGTPITDIVKHLCYLIDRIGEDRVGFGSDFDGVNVPDALGDVAGMPRLLEAMTRAGINDALREKLAWRNWLRVLMRTWGG